MTSTTTERPQPAVTIGTMVLDTLAGDIRDVLLDRVKGLAKPFAQLSEREQQREIDALDQLGRNVARRSIELVVGRDFPLMPTSVGKLQKKDGFIRAEITAKYSRDNLTGLAEAGEAVMVMTSLDAYNGARASARATPDQSDLDLGETEEVVVTDGVLVDEDGVVQQAGDDAAVQAQNEALAEGGTADPAPAFDEDQVEQDLGPEAIANGAALEAGISALPHDGATGEIEPVEQQTAAPKKRGRRTVEERVAANVVAAAQEPPPKRTRGVRRATQQQVEAAQSKHTA